MNKLLRHRLFARLLILLCLLLYTSTGQAFWCAGAKGAPHLKMSSIGARALKCHPEAEKHQQNAPQVLTEAVLSEIGSDCFHLRAHDSVITSTNKDCFKNKPASSDFFPPDPLPNFNQKLPAEYPRNQFIALQLPPPQALTALRTVVLLH